MLSRISRFALWRIGGLAFLLLAIPSLVTAAPEPVAAPEVVTVQIGQTGQYGAPGSIQWAGLVTSITYYRPGQGAKNSGAVGPLSVNPLVDLVVFHDGTSQTLTSIPVTDTFSPGYFLPIP